MEYQTTKLNPMKSYPTYQLHAYSSAHKIDVHDCFKICILETFKWLRLRLEKFSGIDKRLQTPEPENYKDFSDDSLCSFKGSPGIDVIYIKNSGIWTFNISEADMGVNIGTPKERKPVQGRNFSTDVTFKKLSDCVEIGIRTICSEPTDTAADCEVFRPSLVKMLASNPLVGLKYHYPINGQAFEISSKTDVEKLSRVIKDNEYCFPVILVADAPYKENSITIEDIGKDFASKIEISPLNSPHTPINADMSKVNIDINMEQKNKLKMSSKRIKKEIAKEIARAIPKEHMIIPDINRSENIKEKDKIIDYKSFASGLIGFAVVFFINENSFKWLNNKLGISMERGSIIVFNNKNSVIYNYSQYKDKLKQFQKELYSDIKSIQKRRQIEFGNIIFSVGARLLEIEEKRNEDITKDETIKLLMNERNELKKQIEESERRENDATQNNDELRSANRKIVQLESELENVKAEYEKLKEKYESILSSYKSSSAKTDFYKRKCIAASAFPTDKNDVCDWVEKSFSDTLIISSRARSELSKYSGAMNVSILCDGLYFLHGLVQSYRKEIPDEELAYYAESGKWTVERCGKNTLRSGECKDAYVVQYNKHKYTLDLHIKYGINSNQLIRIYFCYLKNEKKMLIGSMPTHLPTSTQNT